MSSANQFIKDNKRRIIGTMVLFVAPIVLAILLNGERLLAEEILLFTLAIAVFLIALLVFCLFKLKTYGSALRKLDKGLSSQQFSNLHQDLDKNEINEAFINKNIDIFKTVLKTSMPLFVQQRLNDVILRLERCKKDFEYAYELMNNTSVPMSYETSWRFLGHFFVNALLFIGIIGTFHGLIIAFSGDKMVFLLGAHGTPDFNPTLIEVFKGFHEAFGSSLIAYISYLFGRVMLEIVDADHEALEQFLEQRLRGDFATIFPKQKQEPPRIELPEELKILLVRSAESLGNISKTQKDLVKQFEKTVNRYEKISKAIVEALLEGRRAWKDATDVWKDTTNNFMHQSQAFIKNLQSLQANIDKLIEVNNKFIATWEQQMGELNQALTDQYDKYTHSITQLNQEIATHINAFQDTRQLVTNLASQIQTGQAMLQQSAQEITDEERKSRQRYTGQLQNVFQLNAQNAQEILGALQTQQAQLTTIREAIQQLDNVFTGSTGSESTSDDLLSVLRDLRDCCGVTFSNHRQ